MKTRFALATAIAVAAISVPAVSSANGTVVCEIMFGVGAAADGVVAVDTVDFTVVYAGIHGSFVDEDGASQCSVEQSSVTISAFDGCRENFSECDPKTKELRVAMMAGPSGITLPSQLGSCRFATVAAPSALDFDLVVNPSLAVGSGNSVVPQVDILDITCS
ncbi:MAG TPA: hypothetical protein VEL28_03930 [Candidatus Binatia bacterium]|nr:hypothetical protein [Candidatus Binatia bacterium]